MPICAVNALPERPGDHDRGQQDPDLAQGRDAEQVDREDLGAEAAQLIGALIGHHDADQERDQADDRQRVDAGLLQVMGERGQPQPRRLQRRTRARVSTVWP